MNIVIMTGNLTADPEMRYTDSNMPVTKFRIGVRGGSKKRGDLFIDVQCWDKLAESVAEYTAKGRLVAVTGELQEDTWEDKDGNKRSKMLINARNVEFLDKPDRDDDDDRDRDRGRGRDRDRDDDRGRGRDRDRDDRGRGRDRDDDRGRGRNRDDRGGRQERDAF